MGDFRLHLMASQRRSCPLEKKRDAAHHGPRHIATLILDPATVGVNGVIRFPSYKPVRCFDDWVVLIPNFTIHPLERSRLLSVCR